jgi:hypothetical protein
MTITQLSNKKGFSTLNFLFLFAIYSTLYFYFTINIINNMNIYAN